MQSAYLAATPCGGRDRIYQDNLEREVLPILQNGCLLRPPNAWQTCVQFMAGKKRQQVRKGWWVVTSLPPRLRGA